MAPESAPETSGRRTTRLRRYRHGQRGYARYRQDSSPRLWKALDLKSSISAATSRRNNSSSCSARGREDARRYVRAPDDNTPQMKLTIGAPERRPGDVSRQWSAARRLPKTLPTRSAPTDSETATNASSWLRGLWRNGNQQLLDRFQLSFFKSEDTVRDRKQLQSVYHRFHAALSDLQVAKRAFGHAVVEFGVAHLEEQTSADA